MWGQGRGEKYSEKDRGKGTVKSFLSHSLQVQVIWD